MATNLADLESRLAVSLMDTLHRMYPITVLDEGIRKALNEYSTLHATAFSLQNLDGAGATTLPPLHEEIILIGAAGFAVQARAIAEADAFNQAARLPADLAGWSEKQITIFKAVLLNTFEQDRIQDLHHAPVPPWDSTNTWHMPDEKGETDF